ncbi:MAG: TIR domain-containing protein [Gammaproteobacteria bacterium]|nr:TIR domain-containing protein [Gammaproteobacteria bacterium]
MANITRHKVFVSFHHEDEYYKSMFCSYMGTDIVDKSVEDGDINPYIQTDTIRQKIRDDFIADASVTAVLIGRCTWQRKHVDWEIGSSLRDTKRNSRCGLLGILLPNHPNFGATNYNPHLVPPRLADNCSGATPFARIYDWPGLQNKDSMRRWIHTAFERRLRTPNPDNSRSQFGHNRSGPCSRGWTD